MTHTKNNFIFESSMYVEGSLACPPSAPITRGEGAHVNQPSRKKIMKNK